MSTFYFLGIGGSAMGQVACLLHSQGHKIFGADNHIYPPMSENLKQYGIFFDEGYDFKNVIDKKPDYVVIGNALGRGNPIIENLLNTQDYPMISLPELIAKFFIQKRPSIIITGTHGKTTTTSATAYILHQLQKNPGYLIGGVPQDLPTGAHCGENNAPFIIEGDEYDSAFFDKRSKFIHYKPQILAIGNLEFDHADIFRDLEDVKRTFRHLIRLVPQNGMIIYNGDDDNLNELLPVPWTHHYSVGFNPRADLRITHFTQNTNGISFELIWKNHSWGIIQSPLHGIFNARNLAISILASALALDIKNPQPFNFEIIKNFNGVKRRQEIRAKNTHWTLIEDFAHHPTAITHTLESLKNTYPQSRIWAIFEPRSNTTATNIFQQALHDSLQIADHVLIAPIYRKNHLLPEASLNTETIIANIQEKKGHSHSMAYENYDLLIQDMEQHVKNSLFHDQHNIGIVLSNGDCEGLILKLKNWIA